MFYQNIEYRTYKAKLQTPMPTGFRYQAELPTWKTDVAADQFRTIITRDRNRGKKTRGDIKHVVPAGH